LGGYIAKEVCARLDIYLWTKKYSKDSPNFVKQSRKKGGKLSNKSYYVGRRGIENSRAMHAVGGGKFVASSSGFCFPIDFCG